MSNTVTLVKIEDHEGTGTCGACDREGLRWICILSDGSAVGIECAKKVMGYRPAPKMYNWIPDYTLVAEKLDYVGGPTYGLYVHKTEGLAAETINGKLTEMGDRTFITTAWVRRGWIEAA